jgi:hypothetical protein
MRRQGTAGSDELAKLTDPPAAPGGRPRMLAARSAALVALAAAVAIPTLAGSGPGRPGRALAAVGFDGTPAQAVALGGGAVTCGGIRLNPRLLPGRPIGPAEQTGPAAGVAQVLRLFEWTRRTPYDSAAWSVVDAGTGTALLVATAPTQPTRYVPVHRQPDGHWQIDTPCQLQHAR